MSQIEVTGAAITVAAEVAEDEMIRCPGRDLGTIHRDEIIRAILTAGLAVIEQDYLIQPRCPEMLGGWRCTLPAAHVTQHYANLPGGSRMHW